MGRMADQRSPQAFAGIRANTREPAQFARKNPNRERLGLVYWWSNAGLNQTIFDHPAAHVLEHPCHGFEPIRRGLMLRRQVRRVLLRVVRDSLAGSVNPPLTK